VNEALRFRPKCCRNGQADHSHTAFCILAESVTRLRRGGRRAIYVQIYVRRELPIASPGVRLLRS
jgi:hypothetical protein